MDRSIAMSGIPPTEAPQDKAGNCGWVNAQAYSSQNHLVNGGRGPINDKQILPV